MRFSAAPRCPAPRRRSISHRTTRPRSADSDSGALPLADSDPFSGTYSNRFFNLSGQAMTKADPSDATQASRREAAQPARLRRVSREELVQILTVHRRYLETNRGQRKRGNLAATDLAGHDFSDAVLRRMKLDHALLRSANLAGADLQHACLTRADLGGARLSGANLEGADLEGAILIAADLEFAVMKKTVLRQARLRGADMSGVNLDDADLRDADLGEVNLRGASLRRAQLDRADLRAARLGGAFLSGATLRKADLRGAYLRVAWLDGADLSDADLRNAQGLVRAQLAAALYLTNARLPTALADGQ